jgi:hypothetical protein
MVLPRKDKRTWQRRQFTDLACRILSVCTNSASCERLFSMFGNILTKLRNRLHPGLVQQLAELKLHIRHMDLKDQNAQMRHKKKIIDESLEAEQLNDSSRTFIGQLPDSLPISQASQEPTGFSESSHDMSDAPDTNTEGGFEDIATRLCRLVDTEDTNSDLDTDFMVTDSEFKVSLDDLFNFTDPWWVDLQRTIGMRGLEEELEFYELVNLDAEGEEVVDLDSLLVPSD